MTSLTFRNICIALLAVVAAISLGVSARAFVELSAEGKDLLVESKQIVTEARPKVNTLLTESELAALRIQSAMKGFIDEANDRNAMLARKQIVSATAANMGQLNLALDTLNTTTLPAVNATLTESQLLIKEGREQVLKEIGRTSRSLADIAEKFSVDQQQLTVQLAATIKSGQLTLDALTNLLNSPQLISILMSVDSTAKSFDVTSANVAEMSSRLPTMADQIEKILRTSAKYQRLALVVGLLAQIGRAFF
jgi:hypothetical protein